LASARPDPIDAVVVGSGPNGLAAAITLAGAGRSVVVYEAAPTIGGGMRSAALTLPGFIHDVCSTVQSFARASPFLRALPLAGHGLELIDPPAPLAHALAPGRSVVLERTVEATAAGLGRDGDAYRRHLGPLVESADALFADLLGPLAFPRHPVLAARFGLAAIRPASDLADAWFAGEPARALFAGLAAHAILPLEWWATSAFGLMLGIAAHAAGWPFARGGSQALADALAAHLRSLGGEVAPGRPVASLDELPASRAVILDVTPRQFLAMAGGRLPPGYARRLRRYRYGPGVFKLDWALDGPIPWADPEVARAGTVHLGGPFEEVAASERAAWEGRHVERPFVLLAQASLSDPSRAPAGQHTGWAYCHVPNGSDRDMTGAIESRVERFAPGFRDRILARHVMGSRDFERYNANYVGGDINGGSQELRQLFARPVARLNPYSTPLPGVYLGSSSTPPGGGVHGLCGHLAAKAALREVFGAGRRRRSAPDHLG
jgi:phytoene dehydrogenase-like protein